MMNIDINFMPESTKEIFYILANSQFINSYTLVGGTALGIQLKHRLSEDMGFIYDNDELNISTIKRNIAKLFPEYKITRQDYAFQIDFLVNQVKLTFFSTGSIALPFKVSDYAIKRFNSEGQNADA